MRTFSWGYFFHTSLVLSAVMGLIVSNMYIYVRRRRTLQIVFFHFASLVTGIVLTMNVLNESIIGLSIPQVAFFNETLTYGFNAMAFTWGLVLLTMAFKSSDDDNYKMDLMGIIDRLEDVFLIFSYDHNLMACNHPEMLVERLGSVINTYEEWAMLIKPDASGVCELGNAFYYWVLDAPIEYGRKKVGRVVVLVDVTEQKLATLQIERQNLEISAYNFQLLEEASISEALTEERIKKDLIESVQRRLIDKLDIEISRLSNENAQDKELPNRLREIYKTVRTAVNEFGDNRGLL